MDWRLLFRARPHLARNFRDNLRFVDIVLHRGANVGNHREDLDRFGCLEYLFDLAKARYQKMKP